MTKDVTKWKDKAGNEIDISAMSDSHLFNAMCRIPTTRHPGLAAEAVKRGLYMPWDPDFKQDQWRRSAYNINEPELRAGDQFGFLSPNTVLPSKWKPGSDDIIWTNILKCAVSNKRALSATITPDFPRPIVVQCYGEEATVMSDTPTYYRMVYRDRGAPTKPVTGDDGPLTFLAEPIHGSVAEVRKKLKGKKR